MLTHIPALLTAAALADIQALLAGAPWADGRITAGTQSASVKRNLQLPEESPAARAAGARVLAALEASAAFFSAALPKRVFPPLFNRYQDGMHFGNHIDNAYRTHAASGERIRTDLSATLFLADPASYDGGELVIEDTFGTQTVKLAAGDLVVYPASSVHRVLPVTRGTRLAAFFWIESLVRGDAERRLLHEMDGAISALRAQLGEAPEVVRLTGCYHNLLRRWGD